MSFTTSNRGILLFVRRYYKQLLTTIKDIYKLLKFSHAHSISYINVYTCMYICMFLYVSVVMSTILVLISTDFFSSLYCKYNSYPYNNCNPCNTYIITHTDVYAKRDLNNVSNRI